MSHQSVPYRADIDGLRALAVTMVVLYHAKLGFPGGFIGVDVFFVISGYLITQLIWRRLERGEFSLMDFWERRVRRIYPAMLVMLFVVLLVGGYVLMPYDFSSLSKSAFAQLCMVANFYFLHVSGAGGGYFAPISETRVLLHCWSLSVEEQFYLFFPFLCLVIFKLAGFRRLNVIRAGLLILTVLSFAWAQYEVQWKPDKAFYLLPARAWELSLGALLAVCGGLFSLRRLWRELMAWGGFIAIVIPCFFYDHDTVFPGVAALWPCLGAVLIMAAGDPAYAKGGAYAGKVLLGVGLSWRPVVFIGLVSYSWYLWHWPVLVLGGYWWLANDKPVLLNPALVLVSLLIAVLSWRYVERPFRKGGLLSSRKKLFSAAAAATAFMLAVSVFIMMRAGVPERFSKERFSQALEARDDYAGRVDYNRTADDIRRNEPVFFGVDEPDVPPTIALWGDSHAMCVEPAVHELCKELGLKGVMLSRVGVRPVLDTSFNHKGYETDESLEFSREALSYIQRHHIPKVLLVGYWAKKPEMERELKNTVSALSNSGAKVYVLLNAPDLDAPAPMIYLLAERLGRAHSVRTSTVEEHAQKSAAFYSLVQDKTVDATFIDMAPMLLSADGKDYILTHDGYPVYRDENHLTGRAVSSLVYPYLKKHLTPYLVE